MTSNSGILEGPEEEIYLIEDDFDEEETCDCLEYEIDWEGRATCDFAFDLYNTGGDCLAEK